MTKSQALKDLVIPLNRQLPLNPLHILPILLQIPPLPSLQIDLMHLPQLRLINNLVHKINHRKQRQQDIRIDEIPRIKRRQRRPPLHKRQKHIGDQPKPRVIRKPRRPEGQFLGRTALRLPSSPEADVDEADGPPDDEGGHPAEVDDVPVGLGRTGADVHHAEGAAQVGEDDGGDGDTALVGPPQKPGGFSVLRHEEDGAAADVDGAVNRAETGDEDEGVDEVDTVLEASILQRNRHGALERTPGTFIDVLECVGGAGQAEEEGAAHVDDDDADKDLADGEGHGFAWVLGLGGGYGDGLDARVEGAAEDEDRGDALEAVYEGAGVVPVVEAEGWCAFYAAACVAVGGMVRWLGPLEVCGGETYTMLNKKYAIKPISLMRASQNSASPKVSTPSS